MKTALSERLAKFISVSGMTTLPFMSNLISKDKNNDFFISSDNNLHKKSFDAEEEKIPEENPNISSERRHSFNSGLNNPI